MNHNHFVPANGSSAGSSAVPAQGQPTGANTGSTRTHKSAGKVIDLKPKEAVRPHVKVSLEDINWVRSQPQCVQQLWLDCAAAEQFGSQQRELKTSLSKNAFFKAKSALEARGLFEFERIYSLSKAGRGIVVAWKVENLHGYYRKNYWELLSHEMTTESHTVTAESHFVTAESHTVTAESHFVGEETAKTLTTTTLENSQLSPNQVSTTHQPPTKVVGGVVSIPSEETGSPLGGSPTMRDGVKQEESPQGAPDCPTLSGGVGSDYENQSQLGADPPDPQTQSFEAGLHGGEFHSPPRREPPLSVSQGEEAVVDFLGGTAQTPMSEDSLATLQVKNAAGREPKDSDGDNFSGAGAGVKICEAQLPDNQPTVKVAVDGVTIEVVATSELIAILRQWLKKNFFERTSYPGQERLEEWLFQQLLYASPRERDSFTHAFRAALRHRPGASLPHLIRKALPVLGKKDWELPDDF